MLQIKKAKGGFMTLVKAKNGEILMTSEILETKENAQKNIRALVVAVFQALKINFGGVIIDVDDEVVTKKIGKAMKSKPVIATNSEENKTLVPSKKAPKTKSPVKVTIKKNK